MTTQSSATTGDTMQSIEYVGTLQRIIDARQLVETLDYGMRAAAKLEAASVTRYRGPVISEWERPILERQVAEALALVGREDETPERVWHVADVHRFARRILRAELTKARTGLKRAEVSKLPVRQARMIFAEAA